jgi:hypothetical protein
MGSNGIYLPLAPLAERELSPQVDFRDVANNTAENRGRIRRAGGPAAAYELAGCPGLFVLPGAVSMAVQQRLACCALRPPPPPVRGR